MLSFSAERIQLESASGRTAPEKGKLSGAGLRANLGEKASQSQPINIYIYISICGPWVAERSGYVQVPKILCRQHSCEIMRFIERNRS